MEEEETESLVLQCNRLAMEHLRVKQMDQCLNLLKRAEELVDQTDLTQFERLRLLGLTFNNFGCAYKRGGKLNVALKYLQEVLDIELRTENDSKNLSTTHLNVCAILSQLGKHEKALEHGKKALLYYARIPNGDISSTTTKCIAYYNVAAELEHLNKYDESLELYRKGYDIAAMHLGSDNELTKQLSKSMESASKKLKLVSSFRQDRFTSRLKSRVALHKVGRTTLRSISPLNQGNRSKDNYVPRLEQRSKSVLKTRRDAWDNGTRDYSLKKLFNY